MSATSSVKKIPSTRVGEWYEDRSVLVTGATGFLGKVVVEKLLRSCPGIKTIYLLLRTKRDVVPSERLETLTSSLAFAQLHEKQPNFIRKLVVVSGDLSEQNFSLAEEDMLTLRRNVSVIFHCAASVRFNDNLRSAVMTNVVGVERVLQVAEQLPLLEVFLHISTSFCQSDHAVLEERLYPAKADPHKIIDMVSWMNDDHLAAITPKLLDAFPNTYALSKNLAEGLVGKYASKLPIVIARPSIVVPSWNEPIPGWCDSTNGPTGILIGAGKGLIRTILGDTNVQVDVVPVDCVANAIISAVWYFAEMRPQSPYVCNVTNGEDYGITWGAILNQLKITALEEIPIEGGLWYPGGSMTTSVVYHKISTILFQLLPAYTIDFLIFLSGRKPFLVNVQDRIRRGQMMVTYYLLHAWLFINNRIHDIEDTMTPEDRNEFYIDIRPVDLPEYCRKAVIGIKKLILKEDMANQDKARRSLQRLYWLDKAVQFTFYGLLLWLLYSWSEPLLELLESTAGHLATLFHNDTDTSLLADEVSGPPDLMTPSLAPTMSN